MADAGSSASHPPGADGSGLGEGRPPGFLFTQAELEQQRIVAEQNQLFVEYVAPLPGQEEELGEGGGEGDSVDTPKEGGADEGGDSDAEDADDADDEMAAFFQNGAADGQTSVDAISDHLRVTSVQATALFYDMGIFYASEVGVEGVFFCRRGITGRTILSFGDGSVEYPNFLFPPVAPTQIAEKLRRVFGCFRAQASRS